MIWPVNQLDPMPFWFYFKHYVCYSLCHCIRLPKICHEQLYHCEAHRSAGHIIWFLKVLAVPIIVVLQICVFCLMFVVALLIHMQHLLLHCILPIMPMALFGDGLCRR